MSILKGIEPIIDSFKNFCQIYYYSQISSVWVTSPQDQAISKPVIRRLKISSTRNLTKGKELSLPQKHCLENLFSKSWFSWNKRGGTLWILIVIYGDYIHSFFPSQNWPGGLERYTDSTRLWTFARFPEHQHNHFGSIIDCNGMISLPF